MDKNKRKSLVSFDEETFQLLRVYAFYKKRSIKNVIEHAVNVFLEEENVIDLQCYLERQDVKIGGVNEKA